MYNEAYVICIHKYLVLEEAKYIMQLMSLPPWKIQCYQWQLQHFVDSGAESGPHVRNFM